MNKINITPYYTNVSNVNISSCGAFLYYQRSIQDLLSRNIDIFYAILMDERHGNIYFHQQPMWMYNDKTMFCSLINEKIYSNKLCIITNYDGII